VLILLQRIAWLPNKSVKGTRRPLAVLEFGFYQGSVASLKFSEWRAPYRNVTFIDRFLGTTARQPNLITFNSAIIAQPPKS
jgi:hypothetical protein